MSLIANLIMGLLLAKPQERKPDQTAADILRDLTMYGNALVRIERISPNDVLLRRTGV